VRNLKPALRPDLSSVISRRLQRARRIHRQLSQMGGGRPLPWVGTAAARIGSAVGNRIGGRSGRRLRPERRRRPHRTRSGSPNCEPGHRRATVLLALFPATTRRPQDGRGALPGSGDSVLAGEPSPRAGHSAREPSPRGCSSRRLGQRPPPRMPQRDVAVHPDRPALLGTDRAPPHLTRIGSDHALSRAPRLRDPRALPATYERR
jgi:hypothetical protein